jgi:phosphoribosylformylglycinamidine synthase
VPPQVQGDNTSDLDFGAVQRGDPEMEQKMNRVIRACVEAPGGNPICSLHDQGAGGNGEGEWSGQGTQSAWSWTDLL